MIDNSGTSALISGGTQGLGMAVAECLIRQGCTRLTITGRNADRGEASAEQLRDAGAQIDESSRPRFEADDSHKIYQHLLHATMASRMPDESYSSLVEHVKSLSPEDDSDAARVFRGQVSSFRDWSAANEARHKLRWAWHEYFADFDALIMPIMPTAAFAHDHRPFGVIYDG